MAVGFYVPPFLPAEETKEQTPAKVDSADLKPGLAVLYFYEFWGRHLDDLPSGELALMLGKPGEPIPYLNHKFGKEEVFGSGEKRGVGVQMDGYIHMSSSGAYWFKAFANDGIRVFINEQLVVDDPAWHEFGDQYSTPLSIKISKAGWFPLRVRYNQRKGTATLKLYWKRPGDKKYTIIPEAAYGHTEDRVKKK
jgi:hypothetical protein